MIPGEGVILFKTLPCMEVLHAHESFVFFLRTVVFTPETEFRLPGCPYPESIMSRTYLPVLQHEQQPLEDISQHPSLPPLYASIPMADTIELQAQHPAAEAYCPLRGIKLNMNPLPTALSGRKDHLHAQQAPSSTFEPISDGELTTVLLMPITDILGKQCLLSPQVCLKSNFQSHLTARV